MEKYIHRENLALFKKRLGEPHTDAEREVLMKFDHPPKKWTGLSCF
jgi:hypothetical protein